MILQFQQKHFVAGYAIAQQVNSSGCGWSPVTLGFSQKGFIGFCDVLVERPELQDGFPFVNMSGRPRAGTGKFPTNYRFCARWLGRGCETFSVWRSGDRQLKISARILQR